MERERRYSEFSYENRTLEGVAIPYGVKTTIGDFRERFKSRSFEAVSDLNLTVNHRRESVLGVPILDDTDKSLNMRCVLPKTQIASDTLELIKHGALRGLSIEFQVLKEEWLSASERVIERARLWGISVVDFPAYPDSVVAVRDRVPKIRRLLLC